MFIYICRNFVFIRFSHSNWHSYKRFYYYVIECKKYGLTDNPAKRVAKKLNYKKTQTKRPIKNLDEVSKFIKNIYKSMTYMDFDKRVIFRVIGSKVAFRNFSQV